MRMRKKKNLLPRMERSGARLICDPYAMPGKWRECLPGAREVRIEIGCGKGRFTAETAAGEPEVLFVAVEMVPEAIVVAMERCVDLPNVYFIRAGAEELDSFFAPGEADRIYLNFSDPWPSKRHARRRLTHGDFLRRYRQVLKDGGQIHFKTDNQPLFAFSLQELPRFGFTLSEVTRNLHERGPVGVMTDYEAKFHAQGIPICHLVGTKAPEWAEPFPETAREIRMRCLEAFAPESAMLRGAAARGAASRDMASRGAGRGRARPERNCLWRMLTMEGVPHLEGELARRAFAEKAASGGAFRLFQLEPEVQIRRGKPLEAESVAEAGTPFHGGDWYAADEGFCWLYAALPDGRAYFAEKTGAPRSPQGAGEGAST